MQWIRQPLISMETISIPLFWFFFFSHFAVEMRHDIVEALVNDRPLRHSLYV